MPTPRLLLIAVSLAAFACGGDTTVTSPEQQDPDTDDDGILNVDDDCPTAAETFNNVFDSDGCPDVSMDLYNAVRADVEAFWAVLFTTSGVTYQPLAKFQSYTTPINTACGPAILDNAFYCGADVGVYFDLTLLDRYLSSIGDMAPAFIISHEIGHHISRLVGYVRPIASGKQSELQADCFGGVWTANAQSRGVLESGDLEEAVQTLIDVGDVAYPWFNPNEHGTAQQRVAAFAIGFSQGESGCVSDDFLRLIPSPALWFDGVQDYVEVPDHQELDLAASFTIEAWIAPTNVQSAQTEHVISKWGGVGDASYSLVLESGYWGLWVHGAGDVTQGGWSQDTLSSGVWQHVAVTVSNGIMSLYVNGVLDVQYSGVVTPLNSTRPLTFGQIGPPFVGGYYAGLLDEVRIWSVARSQAQISGSLLSRLTGSEPGLVAYWRFNEGVGDVAYDVSDPTGNGHNGRLGSAVGADANDPLWWIGAALPAVAGTDAPTDKR